MDNCKYCGDSGELWYHQAQMDSYCSECGKWQEDG